MNQADINSLRWNGKDQDIPLGDGLYLRLRRSSKTYYLRQRRRGKVLKTTVGHHPDTKLKAARADAIRLAQEREPNAITVEQLSETYISEIVSGFSRPDQIEGYFNRSILPGIGRRKVTDVTTKDLVDLVKAYRERSKRGASILRRTLIDLFRFAVENGVIQHSPGSQLGNRVTGYRYDPRERVLTDDEIRLVWAQEGHQAKLARFLLLTGTRIGEALRGRPWQVEGDTWVLPANLTKSRREHKIFLTETAKAQLEPFLYHHDSYQGWFRDLCAKHAIEPSFTPHDCRRSVQTRLMAMNIPAVVVEKTIGHRLPGMLAVYDHSEQWPERVEAFKALERHILEVVGHG